MPARAESGPGRFRHDGHAGHQTGELARAGDDKGVTHPRQGLDGFQIRAEHLAAKSRALFEHGVQHARQAHVDAKQRLAGDDGEVVDTADTGTQKLVVARILQLDGFGAWQWQGGGSGGQFGVTQAAAAGLVVHRGIGGQTLASRYLPGLCRRLDQHGARGGSQAQEVVVVVRCRGGAAGALATVDWVQITLHNAHVFPVDFQFFGNHHRQRGLDALADFRLLGNKRDHTLAGDADEGVRLEAAQRRGAARFGDGLGRCGRVQIAAQQQATTAEHRTLQKVAALHDLTPCFAAISAAR